MASTIFNALLEEKIEGFVSAYEKTSRQVFYDELKGRIRHSGEFGSYREILVREFLNFFTPSRLNIHNGFLMTSTDSVSTQCDTVIFDAKSTPLIENGDKQRFFPVETACAIGEVKSILSKSQLKEALNKLARNKALREQIQSPTIIRRERNGQFDPENYAYDQLPSFLICQKLDFDFSSLAKEVDSFYEPDIEVRHRHNLVLSLEDGLLAYADSNNKTMMFPEIAGRILPDGNLSQKEQPKNRFVIPTDKTTYCHIKLFCSYMFLLTSSVTILYPEFTNYMSIGSTTLLDE
ncbi:DUF6602 domain-containing protein [Aliivibrio fischeri]|uniref:DUF6602 domain-containing protein n=1 Tax=Aliivibrio fischeri TaxID=668 RepID=UPI0007C4FD0B|nr:DUF6602 domain-containing protein [Aliivibrio fischeri]MBP3140177.1 hypothetical protein [Aliivibrio fischeri]MBP3140236.1 hypothetical protein [Aliivibrio fischeri]MBP3154559.1 hypothetical protein [Aliivibrio fischeri]MBP3154622.1 hypothetical protein [Aliivibrio fischeri]